MRRRLLAACRWHAATAGLFRRKANPPSSTSSSQASHRLRRVFYFISKLISRSFCCSSLPTATRCAGRAVGEAALRAAFAFRIFSSSLFPFHSYLPFPLHSGFLEVNSKRETVRSKVSAPTKYRTYVLSVDIIYSLCPVLSRLFFSIFYEKSRKLS